jgi:hypothetical protein
MDVHRANLSMYEWTGKLNKEKNYEMENFLLEWRDKKIFHASMLTSL